MQLTLSLEHTIAEEPVILTIGKFDGVHLGHQHLIKFVVERARSLQLRSAVLTFEPHPGLVLHPDSDLKLLTTLEERCELIADLQPDHLVIVPFNRLTMMTSARDYVAQINHVLPLRELWVGENFALGRKREGNVPRLREIGQELGYTLQTVSPIYLDDQVVNSSRIRQLLHEGAVEAVQPLLGRPYGINTMVEEGDKRGHTIGFPTANLAIPHRRAIPAHGVYACMTSFEHDRTLRPTVTNVGIRPTFDGTRRTVEAHLLDWSGNLYGQIIQVDFLHRLRGEQRFNGIDELRAQIARDIEQARQLLATTSY